MIDVFDDVHLRILVLLPPIVRLLRCCCSFRISLRKKRPSPFGDERLNAPAVPLHLGWFLKREPPSVMRRGRKSQPHLIRARQFIRDALCPDNGGDSGASYSAVYCLSPCSSEVHSVVMCARGSHLSPFSVPPYRRVLVLFKAFGRLDCCPSLCELL